MKKKYTSPQIKTVEFEKDEVILQESTPDAVVTLPPDEDGFET